MTKVLLRTARTGLVLFVTAMGVTVGNPLAGPVLLLAAYVLYRLVDYGAREFEYALELASSRRVEYLTWQLRTDAAHLALTEKRLAAAGRPLMTLRDPDLFTPGYGVPLLCGVAA
jgi:hypothetical protein